MRYLMYFQALGPTIGVGDTDGTYEISTPVDSTDLPAAWERAAWTLIDAARKTGRPWTGEDVGIGETLWHRVRTIEGLPARQDWEEPAVQAGCRANAEVEKALRDDALGSLLRAIGVADEGLIQSVCRLSDPLAAAAIAALSRKPT